MVLQGSEDRLAKAKTDSEKTEIRPHFAVPVKNGEEVSP